MARGKVRTPRRDERTATERAKALWSPAGMALSARRFEREVAAIVSLGLSWRARWWLGGALADYLGHSGQRRCAIRVPVGLAETLCESAHVDSRIVGIKLALRGARELRTLAWLAQRMLHDESPEVRCATVYEIANAWWDPATRSDPEAWFAAIGAGLAAAAKDPHNLNRRLARDYIAWWREQGFRVPRKDST